MGAVEFVGEFGSSSIRNVPGVGKESGDGPKKFTLEKRSKYRLV